MNAEQPRLTFASPQVAPPAPRPRASFDAGSTGTRRTVGWRAPTTSANSAVLASLGVLRDRSRAATRNNGFAKSAIDKLVSNLVGTGIKPMSTHPDPAFRKAVQELWLRWTDVSDADGLLDFYGQQSQATRTWLEGGEAFGRLRPRLLSDQLPVALQVQVLEPELCPHSHTAIGSRIRAGIEFDAIGARVAYYFHPSRPELDDFDATQLRRLQADSVLHVFDPLRPGQLRGYPILTQALIALDGLGKLSDATLYRQQLANMFTGFIKRAPQTGDAETSHPLTGDAPETGPAGEQVLRFEPGLLQELDPGEEVVFSNPPGAPDYPNFARQALFEIASAASVPYEVLTGDMRGVNDRTMRVILNEFRRRLRAWQHQILVQQWCRPIWNAWFDRAFLTGALPIGMDYADDPAPWRACKWVPEGWPYLHPVQDVQAGKDAVRAGFRSRAAIVSELGEDVEAIDAEQRADNERADSLGLRYDSDGRTGASSALPGPAPEPDPNDPNNDPAVPPAEGV